MTEKSVVLRNRSNRHLEASISANGDLVIKGQDLGAEVESFFGFSEYEWAWTVSAADLQSFLESEGIEYTAWSRVGD